MRRIFCGLAMLAAGSVVASAALITVNGTDDIFFGGQSSTGGLGTLPFTFVIGSLGPVLQISAGAGSGTVNYCGGGVTCPTGNINGGGGQADPYAGNGTNFPAGSTGIPAGVSGIIFNGQVFFLTGMFTNGSAPSGAAPATLSYASAPTGTISPLLNQVFYVGTGAGESFVVPSGATTLFLGFADGGVGFTGATNTGGFTNTIGMYGDNTGSLSVSVVAAPEPATFGLIGLGLASIGLLRKRIRR